MTARVFGPGVGLYDRPAASTRAFRVLDDLWQLRLPVPYYPDVTVNAFLLRLHDGWCLVDCGSSLPPGWLGLEHALGEAGVRPDEIALLLCTHTHADHYGCAATVLARVGCPFALSRGRPFVIDDVRDPTLPFARRQALVTSAGVPPGLRLLMTSHPGGDGFHVQPEPDRPLAAGDRVAGFTVVPTPGHAPNQIALIDEERRVGITADLLFARRLPYLHYDDESLDPRADQLASLARVEAYGTELVLPGHGQPIRDPAAAIARTRATFERAPARVLEYLRARPRTAWGVVTEEIPEADPFSHRQTALVGTLVLLRELVSDGAAEVADVDADGGEIYRPT